MESGQIAIIGCGNLGLSLVNGFLNQSGFSASSLRLSKRKLNSIKHLEEKEVKLFSDNKSVIQGAKIIIIAVKPHDLVGILNEIDPHLKAGEQILVSTVTGVTIAEIKKHLSGETPVFRVMPNTASDINQAVTCISSSAQDSVKTEQVKAVFKQLGTTIVIKEELMEAATVLGACGIAYVLRFMRSMVQGGIQIGFDSQTATEIVNQVVKGAAELLIERKEHPEHEIDKVTTPKGCTIIGLNEMEHNGFSSSLIKGISASFKQIEK